MKLQTQLETLETRANELRTKRDDAAKQSEALDAQLAQGELDRAGEAANKRAELDAITRALESVERDADAVRGQIAEQGATAARRAHLDEVEAIAQEAADLDAQAQGAAAELARQIEKDAAAIWEKKSRADALRAELTKIAYDAPATLQDALSPELARQIGYQGIRENYPQFAPVQIIENLGSCGASAVGAAIHLLAEQDVAERNAQRYANKRAANGHSAT
jgi:chromosome segregation ATPase